jgi:hypothetical protein
MAKVGISFGVQGRVAVELGKRKADRMPVGLSVCVGLRFRSWC